MSAEGYGQRPDKTCISVLIITLKSVSGWTVPLCC
jgi:hypothetical protein